MPRDGVAESISELASDSARLVRLEIDLLKQELVDLIKRNAIAAGLLFAALLTAHLALIFALVWVVVFVPHHAWAAGGIAIGFLLLTVLLAVIGKSRLKFAPPEATIQTIKDDVEWVKQQIKPEPR
jgi:hypothetical protein